MDLVSIILCMCIGNTAAWLMAVYTERGAYNLIWNIAAGTAGAALWGLAFAWAAPSFAVAGLVFGGPVCAVAAILAVDAVLRRLGFPRAPSRAPRGAGQGADASSSLPKV